MGYGRYVGRVGALAVALGVGVAVANAPGVAWADDSTSAGSAGPHSAVGRHNPGAGPAKAVKSPNKTVVEPVSTSRRSAGAAAAGRSGGPTKVSAASGAAQHQSPASRPDETTAALSDEQPAASSASPGAAATPKAAVVTPDSIVALASDLIGAVFHPPALPQLPPPPLDPPGLWAMLAAARREIVGAFYNRAPTANPLEIGETAGGQVKGVVGATDPDGDPVTYQVTVAPKFGTVAINTDGTYTYTPGEVFAETGGEDQFLVAVRDTGTRWLSQPGVTTVSVTVAVGAGDALGIGGEPYALAMSPDGSRAYVTDIENNRVSVIDVAGHAVIGSIAVGGSPWGITVASDGRAYVVNSDDATVSVIDTTTNTVLGDPIPVGESPTSVAVNSTGSRVYVTNTNDGTVSVIDTASYVSSVVQVGGSPFGVALAGDKVYVTNESDDTVSVIDAATNTVVATIAVGDHPTGVAAAGDRVVVTNSGSLTLSDDGTSAGGSVSVIDTTTMSVIGAPIKVGVYPTDVALNADGTLAYVSDFYGGTVSVVDLQSGQLVGDPIAAPQGAAGIAIGADGRLYVAGTYAEVVDPITLDAPAEATFTALVTPVVASSSVPAASAAPAAATARAVVPDSRVATQRFAVWNLSANNVVFTGYSSTKDGFWGNYKGNERPISGPALNTVIPPGGVVYFDVPFATGWLKKNYEIRPIFQTPAVQWEARLATITKDVSWRTGRGSGVYSASAKVVVGADKASYLVKEMWGSKVGDYVYLTDAPGTARTVPATDPSASSMMNLCSNSKATCRFTATGQPVETYSPWRTPDVAPGTSTTWRNPTPVGYNPKTDPPLPDLTANLTYSVTDSVKTNFEFSAKTSITLVKDVLGVELSAKYGAEESTAKTSGGTQTVIVRPGYQVAAQVRTPLVQTTGTLEISMGNTTVTITNATVQFPRKGDVQFQTLPTKLP